MNLALPHSPERAAAIAAHRFGLGEPALASIGSDATGWLLQQIGPAEPQQGSGLASGAEATRVYARFLREQREARRAPPPASPGMADAGMAMADGRSGEDVFAAHFRDLVTSDVRARLVTAASSTRPFNERLALFWANHFTVSMAKASARGIVGAFEREAIRPHIGGRFETLLRAAATHPGMLRYLDNDQSAGPDSALVQRLARRAGRTGDTPRVSGLNENLAREILELHTLGVGSGYTQADVTEFARVLTGWRVAPADAEPTTRFDPAWHQPGPKTVLGKRYPEGPEALTLVLRDLAAHPATARFVCSKLARHLVADEPPPALVARLVDVWRASDGDLAAVTRTLVLAPEAWPAQPAKLKTPEEFVITSARLLQLGDSAFQRPADGGISVLGQRVQAAPSPAGWPDRAEDWLGPDAVWKRVEWATRVAARVGARIDARARAEASLGPLLSSSTRQQLQRAADGPQALALLLLAPEFQRR
jgi:uncharacterized protein (DUF1800 family)